MTKILATSVSKNGQVILAVLGEIKDFKIGPNEQQGLKDVEKYPLGSLKKDND